MDDVNVVLVIVAGAVILSPVVFILAAGLAVRRRRTSRGEEQ